MSKVDDKVFTSFYIKRENESPHFLSYSPESHTLRVETSLPKVAYGENVRMLAPCDVLPALKELTNRVESCIGWAGFPSCEDWQVTGRLDACFAWQVGARLPDYMHAFKRISLSRHVQKSVDLEATLYWQNGKRMIRMYDKGKQSGSAEAKGLIRFEVECHRPSDELKHTEGARWAGGAARDVLTWENARAIMQNYLGQMGNELVITSDEKLFRLLCQHYKQSKAIRLLGFIMAQRLYSRDELKDAAGIDRATIWRNTRDIKKAGAHVATSRSGLLPALRLPDTYTGKAVKARTL